MEIMYKILTVTGIILAIAIIFMGLAFVTAFITEEIKKHFKGKGEEYERNENPNA